jgi:tRNA (mo5U34)-methyltransferase
MPDINAHVLPLRSEDLPQEMQAFDTVFSMGVLYHCRSPFDHLLELKNQLRPGGELVLETLVVEGGPREVLVPQGRYAKMRNVWFIPGVLSLQIWMQRCGFSNIRVVDVTTTTVAEQRSTDWMTFESLPDFLDVTDSSKTIEGHPAPVRAVICATRM